MRDDIHTNAPVPRMWKRAIKACTNDSEDLSERVRRFDDAMRSDLAPVRDVLPAVMKGLEEQAQRLPGVRDLDELRALAHTPTQQNVIGHAIRLAEEKGPAAVEPHEVVRCATQELLDRQMRATEGHVMQKFPKQGPELLKRMHACQRGLDQSKLVRSTVQGDLSAKPSRRPALNVDAPLPLGPKGKIR